MYTDEDLEWAYEFNSIIDQGQRIVKISSEEAKWKFKGDHRDCVFALAKLVQFRLDRLEQPKGEPWG